MLALLYAIGGGVLALRLFFESLPSLTVVGQLPREFLISLALTQVALPTAAVAAAYLALRLVVGLPRPTRLVSRERPRPARVWKQLIAWAAGLAALATLVGAGPAMLREGPGWFYAWMLLAFVLTVVVMLVVLELRARLVQRPGTRWDDARVVAAMTAVIALASVPTWLLFAGTFHLLDAKVCLANAAHEDGVLVGETSDRVYVGEKGDGPRRVLSIPLGQVEELFIGGDAGERPCALPDATD